MGSEREEESYGREWQVRIGPGIMVWLESIGRRLSAPSHGKICCRGP